jgi:hypothetical protein
MMKGGNNMGTRVTAFGYVFEERAAAPFQTVAAGGDITFSDNGPLNNITHVPGTAPIIITIPGTYEISFGVFSTVNPQDWGITLNNAVIASFDAAGQSLTATFKLTITDIPVGGAVVTIRNVSPNNVPNALRTVANFISAWVDIEKLD